MGFLTENN